MLKNFLYLNEPMLDGFLSSLEDGLRASAERKTATNSTLSGGVKVYGVGANGERERQEEETTSRSDTPDAKFERLLNLAKQDVEASGWIEVVDAGNDLENVLTGAILEIECEIYIPEAIKALAPSGGLSQVIDQMEAMRPFAAMMNLDTDGLPPTEQLKAFKSLAGVLGSDIMFVGEQDESDKRVAGKLLDAHLRGEIDGYARVIGKVTTQWGTGKWKPLLALPGMNLISRDQRRQMERKGPDEGQQQNWLEGPAFMLDVLAIYR